MVGVSRLFIMDLILHVMAATLGDVAIVWKKFVQLLATVQALRCWVLNQDVSK